MPAAPQGPQPASSKPSAYTGRVLARCRVGDKLGRGATSHVFRAHYEPLAKDIALKILSKDASSEDVRTRFLSEARAVAKLNHENVIKVLDVVEDQGFLCILMELVAGPTLQDRIDDEGALPPRHAFHIASQIARGLEAAHEEKLVHRDVKPANVMLVGARGEEAVKVVDFGLAAQQEMNRVGTPMFMSPEAAQGKRIDEKSDVYALGICLYNMLTGVLPFTGATVKDILAAQVNVEATPPSKARPQLGKAYDDLIKKLLVKSKGYRPTAAEAAEMLEQIADDLEEREVGVRRVRKKRKPKPKKAAPPNPALWAGLAIAGVVVVLLVIAFSGGEKPTTPGGQTSAANPNGPSGTPKPPVVDPAETAFRAVEEWAAGHPGAPKDNARRFTEIETRWSGTTWATQAGLRRIEWEDAARKEAEALAKRGNDLPTEKRTVTDGPEAKKAKMNEAIKSFDWQNAFNIAESFGDSNPPGMTEKQFERLMKCLEYLAKNWVNVLDPALSEYSPKVVAKAVVPSAKDGEVLSGARTTGLFVTDAKGDSRTVPWTETDQEAFLHRPIMDGPLNTEEFKANMVLGALATVLVKDKEARKFRQGAFGKAREDIEHADELTAEAQRVLGDE